MSDFFSSLFGGGSGSGGFMGMFGMSNAVSKGMFGFDMSSIPKYLFEALLIYVGLMIVLKLIDKV